jgi:YebC/PmpR family DNA-binding regulatory protein
MSGHSKWANIHAHKEVTDKKRGQAFSKLARNIIIAAKDGPDPELNFKLRLAIDKAKEANVPKDNIDRAIARGSGQSGEAIIEEVLYEGYGPGGVAVMIEGATDNRNRAASEIKNILTKAGGSFGSQNSTKWMFDHQGVIRIADTAYQDKDTFELQLIDWGASDVKEEEGGLTVMVPFESFPQLKKTLDAQHIATQYAAVEWVAKDPVPVTPTVKEQMEALFDALEGNDDVSNYYSTMAGS